MMNMRIRIIAVTMLFLAGCGVTQNVQNKLEETKSALTYVHDSERTLERSGITIAVRSFLVDDILPAETTVREVSSSVLPFLLYNTWTEEMQAQLGYAQIENDYKQFMRRHFEEELERSGRFTVQNEPADLNIAVRITKLEMSAPVRHRGTFFFFLFIFGGGQYYAAGPVDVAVHANVTAERGGVTVFSGAFVGKYATSILEGKNVRLGDYTSAMIEGTAMAVKDLNQRIVRQINRL
jgi:hypothetical protein